MKVKKKGYPVLLAFTLLMTLAGIAAAFPYAGASKPFL